VLIGLRSISVHRVLVLKLAIVIVVTLKLRALMEILMIAGLLVLVIRCVVWLELVVMKVSVVDWLYVELLQLFNRLIRGSFVFRVGKSSIRVLHLSKMAIVVMNLLKVVLSKTLATIGPVGQRLLLNFFLCSLRKRVLTVP